MPRLLTEVWKKITQLILITMIIINNELVINIESLEVEFRVEVKESKRS